MWRTKEWRTQTRDRNRKVCNKLFHPTQQVTTKRHKTVELFKVLYVYYKKLHNMHPSLDFWTARVSLISTYWRAWKVLLGAQLTANHCFRGKGGYRRSNWKKNDMEIRQNLPFASNVRYPFVCAFDYLRRIIDISNQFLDERGEWICSVKTETLLKAS